MKDFEILGLTIYCYIISRILVGNITVFVGIIWFRFAMSLTRRGVRGRGMMGRMGGMWRVRRGMGRVGGVRRGVGGVGMVGGGMRGVRWGVGGVGMGELGRIGVRGV